MKWNKEKDTFELTRNELANLTEFFSSIELFWKNKITMIKKDWEFYKKAFAKAEKILAKYTYLPEKEFKKFVRK